MKFKVIHRNPPSFVVIFSSSSRFFSICLPGQWLPDKLCLYCVIFTTTASKYNWPKSNEKPKETPAQGIVGAKMRFEAQLNVRSWQYFNISAGQKTCDMPYISVSVLRFQIFNRKILPPQHMGVKPFSDYPVAAEGYLHDPAPQWRHNRARLTEQSFTIFQ